jgi:hypothetical protein
MIALTYTQLACLLVGSASVGGLIVWLAVAPINGE